MHKWLWIAPMLAAAGWAQSQSPIPTIVPETPVGGFVLPSGTELSVRIDGTLSTNRNEAGDAFTGTLTAPVMQNGTVVLPAGSPVTGHVLENHPAGILKGHARMVLGLDTLQRAGRTFHLELTAATYEAPHAHKKLKNPDPNAKSVVGDRLVVTIPAETVVHFTLGSPVRV